MVVHCLFLFDDCVMSRVRISKDLLLYIYIYLLVTVNGRQIQNNKTNTHTHTHNTYKTHTQQGNYLHKSQIKHITQRVSDWRQKLRIYEWNKLLFGHMDSFLCLYSVRVLRFMFIFAKLLVTLYTEMKMYILEVYYINMMFISIFLR